MSILGVVAGIAVSFIFGCVTGMVIMALCVVSGRQNAIEERQGLLSWRD